MNTSTRIVARSRERRTKKSPHERWSIAMSGTKLVLDGISADLTVGLSERAGKIEVLCEGAPGTAKMLFVNNDPLKGEISIRKINDNNRSRQPKLGDIRLEVHLPRGTALTLRRFGGAASIEELSGVLLAHVVDSGRLNVKKAEEVDIMASDSSRVTIENCRAMSAILYSSSAGTISVKDGEIRSIRATVSDRGSISIGGLVMDAQAEMLGCGHIYLDHITRRLQNRHGHDATGTIKVGDIEH